MIVLSKSCVVFLLAFVIVPTAPAQKTSETHVSGDPLILKSFDNRLVVICQLGEQGRPAFEVSRRGTPLVSGTLALEVLGADMLGKEMRIVGTRRKQHDQTYPIPVGKTSSARDHHRELIVSLEEKAEPHRRLDIAFRAFDDGIAFRYIIPKQQSLTDVVITQEHTLLSFTQNAPVRFLRLKEFTTSYEAYYRTEDVWDIRADAHPLIGLPILLEYPGGPWIAVTEADLTDYAGAYLVHSEAHPHSLKTVLSPYPDEATPKGSAPGAVKVIGTTPLQSPWRVLMIADNPGKLIESNIVFHLNEPSKIKDPSWIRPGKTTFPWWNHYVLENVDFKAGVNTATMKRYIDFCAEQGIPYHTLDGLDIAWYGGPIQPKGPTDVTTAAPSIDMPELLRYAKEKGVRLRLWMHWKALQPQLDEAFATYEKWGIEGVMIDFMDRDDQEMVRWYHEVAERAAKHHLTVTWHGAYKPTGMERTWPNVLSYEAVLNQEYNKWQRRGLKGAPPEHNLDVAFIRMLAGPLDYHQGGMRSVLPENYEPSNVAPPVQGSRGHQLAMYVVYQNHLSMLADYPSAYRGQPGLEFLAEVPANWDETRVLHAEMGKCIVIARRKGTNWYLGGMTAREARSLELPLTFLGDGSYTAELYLDGEAAGISILRREQTVAAKDAFIIEMPASGGFVGRLVRDDRLSFR